MREPKKRPKCGNRTWILSQDLDFSWELYVKYVKCGYEDAFVNGKFIRE